jgi:4-amino-4-deoxy-L-arabinose transferase-like glycosyltransferase
VTGSLSRRREWALALGTGLLVLLLRAPLVDLPLERDEGEYAYIAWRLEHGELPYRDWFDQKPPGIFLAYRLALVAPGQPVEAIRGLAALVSAGSVVALYFLARRLLSAPAAWLAALLLGCISADPFLQGPIANTELFMLPWLILANLAFLAAARGAGTRVLPSLLAGGFLGLATGFKPVAAVDAALFVLLLPLIAKGGPWFPRLLRFTGWAVLGGLAVWLPVLAWFHARGGLEELLDAVFLHNFAYAGGLGGVERLRNLLSSVPALWEAAAAACVLAGVGLVFLARGSERWRARYLAGWLVASAVGASASGYYFEHYFQQLLPPLAVAAAAGVVAFHPAPALQRVRGALLAVALASIALVAPVLHSVALWPLTPAQAMESIYPESPFEVMPEIAAEVAALTAPDDTVFVYGSEAEIFFHAQRRSASRYIFLFPLFGPYSDALDRQRSVIEEVRRARPAVTVAIPNSLFFGPQTRQDLPEWLDTYVAQNYRTHALVVAEPGDRGRMLRASDAGFDADSARRAWAKILVRR